MANDEVIANFIADVHVLPEDVRDYKVIDRLLERVIAQNVVIAELEVERDAALESARNYRDSLRAASAAPEVAEMMADAWDRGARELWGKWLSGEEPPTNPYRDTINATAAKDAGFTPTLETLRYGYIGALAALTPEQKRASAEFDRGIAAHDAAIKASAWDEGLVRGMVEGYQEGLMLESTKASNPYRDSAE